MQQWHKFNHALKAQQRARTDLLLKDILQVHYDQSASVGKLLVD